MGVDGFELVGSGIVRSIWWRPFVIWSVIDCCTVDCKVLIRSSKLLIRTCIACISVWYCDDNSETLVGVPSVIVVGEEIVESFISVGALHSVTCSIVVGIFGRATSAQVFGKE